MRTLKTLVIVLIFIAGVGMAFEGALYKGVHIQEAFGHERNAFAVVPMCLLIFAALLFLGNWLGGKWFPEVGMDLPSRHEPPAEDPSETPPNSEVVQ